MEKKYFSKGRGFLEKKGQCFLQPAETLSELRKKILRFPSVHEPITNLFLLPKAFFNLDQIKTKFKVHLTKQTFLVIQYPPLNDELLISSSLITVIQPTFEAQDKII